MEDATDQPPRVRLDWDERELAALNYCALRFDGYKFFNDKAAFVDELLKHDEAEFVISSIPSFDDFLDEPDFDLPINTLQAMHFIFQRAWFRNGWLRTNSFGAKIYRELFLLLCREPIDPVYRNRAFIDTWETEFMHRVDGYAEMVETSLKTIEFNSKELWQKERQ